MEPLIIEFGSVRKMVVAIRTVFVLHASALFVYVGVLGLGKVIAHPSAQLAVNEFVLVPWVITILVSQGVYTLRYGRSVFTALQLSQPGLRVQNAREGSVMLYWAISHTPRTAVGDV